MAGSVKRMLYTDDLGVEYAVNIDESNGESCDFQAYSSAPALPRNLKMRYVLGYFNDAPSIRRKIYIGTLAFMENIRSLNTPSIQLQRYPGLADEEFVITFTAGETYQYYASVDDTGINDGDNP